MKKLLFLCITLFLFANESILRLDTKGHIGIINDIIVTKNADIISASSDKTIRVWGKNGIEKRKILGEIGKGNKGKIFAIALSPNEKYLAVGGFLENFGNIRIYNYKSGKLIKLLKSHTNIVNNLAFSDDEKYLISASSDKTAKIWNMKNFTLFDTIKTHKNSVYASKIIQNRYAVIAGLDGKLDIYDIQNHHSIKSRQLNDRLLYLAINKIKHQIAVCGDNHKINIYDYNLNHIKTIHGNHIFAGLNYSKDGKYLIAGASSEPNNVNIYKTDNYSLYKVFKKHTNLVKAVNFINDSLAVSGGGDNNEIYIWDTLTTKVIQKIVGVGKTIWSVGINGDNIAWGNTWAKFGDNKLTKQINLKTFKIRYISKYFQNISDIYFNKIPTINGSYSLTTSKGGEFGIDDAILNIKYHNKIIHQIIKNSHNGYENNCYGWYLNYIVSGGSHGQLRIYNINGQEIANLIGHTGEINSLALDKSVLVSGSDDQTIKLWDLSKISNNLKYTQYFMSWVKDFQESDNLNYNQAYQKTINLYNKRKWKIYTPQKIYPFLTIFISKNNDYIVWSKSGYFNATPKGVKYLGYHINQGVNKEAKWVGIDKYFNTFHRPDIIKYLLQTHNEAKAITIANQHKK